MNRPRVLVARHLLARYLFVAWTTIAPRERTGWDIESVVWEEHSDPFQRLEDRLLAMTQGRYIEVWLPLGLERRLKAALHRMNASITCAAWDQESLFDPREDINIILISAAKYGVHDMEIEDDVYYDENTGLALDRLQEIS